MSLKDLHKSGNKDELWRKIDNNGVILMCNLDLEN
jgi:hypothetical protein